MKIKNPTLAKTVKVVTIAGASVLVLRSATQLMGVKTAKDAIMPLVSILVGVAAFSYALSAPAPTLEVKK